MANDTVTGSPGRATPPDDLPSGGETDRSAPVRWSKAVVASIASDFTTVFSLPIALVREKKPMAIPGTLVCVALIGFFGLIQHSVGGLSFMLAVAGIHQNEPLWEVLTQIPLSMFAPAPDLPVWGALTQVFIAFGIAECWLGWKRTVGIAVWTSAVTSVVARIMAAVSSHLFIGTPEVDKFQLDTGPSVAVVALLVYLALRLRTYWIVAVTALSMGSEAAILPNLAGREHLVAISLGFITYFLLDFVAPTIHRRWSAR